MDSLKAKTQNVIRKLLCLSQVNKWKKKISMTCACQIGNDDTLCLFMQLLYLTLQFFFFFCFVFEKITTL